MHDIDTGVIKRSFTDKVKLDMKIDKTVMNKIKKFIDEFDGKPSFSKKRKDGIAVNMINKHYYVFDTEDFSKSLLNSGTRDDAEKNIIQNWHRYDQKREKRKKSWIRLKNSWVISIHLVKEERQRK